MQASNANETPQDDTVYLQYDTAFPLLHGAPGASHTNGVSKPKSKSVKPWGGIKANLVKEFIEIPCSERAQNYSSKKTNSLSQLAADLSKQHSVQVDINSSKSQSLTIVISGAPENVANAKCAAIRSLQTQSKLELRIDPKYHRFIIGKGGSTLIALERETATKINVPSSNKGDPEIITITGTKNGCDAARRKIMSIVDVQSKLSSERLNIPKTFHAFIKGPRRNNITRWTETHKVRIDMAPPASPAEDICVSGDKQKVEIVVAEINKIYNINNAKSKRCVISVPKAQHRLVFGPKGSGLDEILESTGVSVELPQNESDEVVLFGPPEKMGTAMSMVIAKASSSIRDEIVADNRFHKVLIGKSGSALSSLLEGYQDRVRVEFGNQTNRIELEGPVADVQEVKQRLTSRLAELEQSMAIETINVPSKYHGLIVGREGANVKRIREKYNCQISLNTNLNETSEITVEGDSKNIHKAVNEIKEFVKRLENEKVKDLIIEPDIQVLLRQNAGGAPPIRALYDEFPKVTFHWPVSMDGAKNNKSAADPSNQVCQLSGQRQDVDSCAEKLVKLVKNVKESNFHHEFRVYKEFRPTFFARENNKVRAILNELQCRLQNPPAGSDSSAPSADKTSELWWIVGREKQVHTAVDRIDALQRQIMNMKEVRLPIPTFVMAKAIGKEAPRLRSIKEQCDGVSFKFPRTSPEANTSAASAKEIIVYGPSEAVEKAKKLIEELNNKVAELCEEAVIPCDKKFHGMLIGRSGQNIASFREKHNVELVFPDRYEIDPGLANEIRILGSKTNVATAKKELFDQIKTLEDESEVVLQVPQEFLRNVRQAFNKLEERIRLNIIRSGKKNSPKASPNEEEATAPSPEAHADVEVKLSGPKAMVETTKNHLKLLIDDLVRYSKEPPREFSIKDKFHVRILGRMKNQLPDLEAQYRVLIKVELPTREQVDAMPNNPTGQTDAEQAEIGKVIIYGRPEQIDSVWEEGIRPNLPINKKFQLDKELHRYLVVMPDSPKKKSGHKKESAPEQVNKVTELQNTHGIYVKLPPVNQANSDFVTLSGTPAQVEAAETQLKEWVAGWEADRQDRIARNYEEKFEMKECYIPFVMANHFEKWRDDQEVYFRVERQEGDARRKANTPGPEDANGDSSEQNGAAEADKDDIAEDEYEEPLYPADVPLLLLSEGTKTVLLRGYKEKVALVRKELDALLKDLESQERAILNIPQKVHSQLIGAKRSKQLRMQKEYGVQVEFPDRNAKGESAYIVAVMGPSDKVDSACHYLISTAQELLDRMESRPQTQSNVRTGGVINFNGVVDQVNGNSSSGKNRGGVVIVGGPWSNADKNGSTDA